MKYIQLSPDGRALVNNDDFVKLSKYKWQLHGGYACRVETINGKRRLLYMHVAVNNTPVGLVTDHINRNKLDNRRGNLRSVTQSKNMFNTGLFRHNKSGHKGISWYKRLNKWIAEIQVNGKNTRLGYYSNISDAIKARQKAEKEAGIS